MSKGQRARAAYRYMQMQVYTAGKQKRICMLHDRCVELISMGIKQPGEDRRILLIKAQNILARLQSSLDMRDDLSQSLFYLYDYVYVLLENAVGSDLLKAYRMISELRSIFSTLRLN